jgi:hypothetical protein
LLPGSQTGRSPAPTLPLGQWASLRYTSFAGGRGSCGFQEHICDVNSSACCAYVTSFYTFRVSLLSTATFLRPFSCTFLYIHAYIHLWTHSYIFAAIFVSSSYIHSYIHRWMHSGLDTYTHLWTHSGLYSAGCLSTPLFYAYTHLWTHSGLYIRL